MSAPNPNLLDDSPIAVQDARVLFRTDAVTHRMAASLRRLPNGRLLLAFRQGTGPGRRNDGAVMLTHSDDGGVTWAEPRPLFAYPGWDCLPLGGLALLPNDRIALVIGRLQIDLTLGGPEPITGWRIFAVYSEDGGETWSEPGPDIDLFPCWTELYGTSNPHPLPDGRLLWGVIGTLGRDQGWQAGVTITGPRGDDFSPPVIIAASPDRDYGDIDLVRLADGRLLAVIREFTTFDAVSAHSSDDGATWTPVRSTGFQGANIKLHRLRSDAILCLYRDEDPAQPGVSASLSDDGGETWRQIGQLYAAGSDQTAIPGNPCGYPDLISFDSTRLLAILHTYPDERGHVDLHQLTLDERA